MTMQWENVRFYIMQLANRDFIIVWQIAPHSYPPKRHKVFAKLASYYTLSFFFH